MSANQPSGKPWTASPVTISTGQTVTFPLRTRATMLGATVPAPRAAVADLLPQGLRPLRATPGGKGAVTLLSVEYHAIGIDGIDPYDEFAVVLPAVHESSDAPMRHRVTSGYVWYLPVTTESGTALGVDVWGYPKEVAEIIHEDDGTRRTTTVRRDGDRFVTFEVERPPSTRGRVTGHTYSQRDGDLLRTRVEASAEVGLWPYSGAVSVAFGDHSRATRLRELGLGDRALARFVVEGDLAFYPGEPV